MHIYIYVCVCVCVYIYVCVCICVHADDLYPHSKYIPLVDQIKSGYITTMFYLVYININM